MASTPFTELISLREQTASLPLRKIYLFEPVAATVALALLLPLLMVVAAVITALSRRSPLIRHTRVGWRGETLRMWKFRTMWGAGEFIDCDPTIKSADDPRVTSRFAAWCRRTSIDELPQLFHVVQGQMSFVGPRPITRVEIDKFYGDCAAELLSLRPGLTGLWQLMGRNRLSYAQRRELDLLFVRRASARLYFSILLKTVPRVLTGAGAY
ncbi:MAG TPA: sugar transferase [Bryobacteraceae bacterium]|nr:sugar transferase [Bryobacteraceae bacterium]